MDISRASRSPLTPTPAARPHPQGHARRSERLAAETSAPERTPPERQPAEPAERAHREHETHAVERPNRQANGLLEGFRAARRGLGSTTPTGPGAAPGNGGPDAANGPGGVAANGGLQVDESTRARTQAAPAGDRPNAEAAVLLERFMEARDRVGVRLENALQGVTNPDDVAFLQERAALAEERLFTRFANALGGLFLPNEPTAAQAPAAADPVARVVNVGPGSGNVSATQVSLSAPATQDAPASAPVDPEEVLVERLVAANESIDRRLANALEGVTNPDDVAFLQDRADAARERVTTRFLNALGSERGVALNAAGSGGSEADRMLVDRFLEARASFDQRAQNALASATEAGARGAIEERLGAAQDRIAGRLLAALGNAPVAPSDPPVAVDPQQGPRTFTLDAGQITATRVGAPSAPPASSNEVAQAGAGETDPADAAGTEQADPRRVFAERIRAAFESLRARATQAFEGTETRREQLGLAERLASARAALVTRVQHGSGPDEA